MVFPGDQIIIRLFSFLLCLLLAGPISLPAWSLAQAENRVGGSPDISSIFAPEHPAQVVDSHGENPGTDYNFASGVHKYLYCQDNPVDGVDPLGLFTQRFGCLAEAAIRQVYQLDHPGDAVLYGQPSRFSAGGFSGYGRIC
jgi:hypothetical protein